MQALRMIYLVASAVALVAPPSVADRYLLRRFGHRVFTFATFARRHVRRWAVAGMVLGASSRADAASLSACSCEDIKLVKARRANANAAMEAYYRLVESYERQEQACGKPVMHDAAEQAKADEEVQRAINDRKTLNDTFKPLPPSKGKTGDHVALKSVADTNGADCSVSVRTQNECLRSIMAIHEGVHQQACSAYHGASALPFPWNAAFGHHADYKDSMRMVEFCKEEVRAYQAEEAAIEESAATFRNCRKLTIKHNRKFEGALECSLVGSVSLRLADSGKVECGALGGGCETVSTWECHGRANEVRMDASGTVRQSLSGARSDETLALTIASMVGWTGSITACNPQHCQTAPFAWGVFPPQSFSIPDEDGAEARARSEFGEYHFHLRRPWK